MEKKANKNNVKENENATECQIKYCEVIRGSCSGSGSDTDISVITQKSNNISARSSSQNITEYVDESTFVVTDTSCDRYTHPIPLSSSSSNTDYVIMKKIRTKQQKKLKKTKVDTNDLSDSGDDIPQIFHVSEVLCCYSMEYFKIAGKKFCVSCSSNISTHSSENFIRIFVEGHRCYFVNPTGACNKIFESMRCSTCKRIIGKIMRQSAYNAYSDCRYCRTAILRAEKAGGVFKTFSKKPVIESDDDGD